VLEEFSGSLAIYWIIDPNFSTKLLKRLNEPVKFTNLLAEDISRDGHRAGA
jgi:hypothetical protein